MRSNDTGASIYIFLYIISIPAWFHMILVKLDDPCAYTGLPVVRVTQKQKGLSWVELNCSVSVNFFTSGVIKTI